MERRKFLTNTGLALGALVIVPNVVLGKAGFSLPPEASDGFLIDTDVHIRHGLYALKPKDHLALGRITYFKSDVFLGASSNPWQLDDQMKLVSFGLDKANAVENYVIVKGDEGVNFVCESAENQLDTSTHNVWQTMTDDVQYGYFTEDFTLQSDVPTLIYALSGSISGEGLPQEKNLHALPHQHTRKIRVDSGVAEVLCIRM